MSVAATGVGHFQIPTAPAAGVSVVSGAANALTGTAIVLSASTSAIFITGVHVETSAALAATYVLVQLCQGGSGAETSIGQYLVPLSTASTVALGFHNIYPPLKVAALTRLTVKTADSVGSKTTLITVEAILQSNVVDDGVAVATVTTVTNQLTAAAIATGIWQDTTAGDFTAALSVGKSLMNGVALGTGLTINAYTGNTVQTGDSFARIGAAGAGLTALGDTRIANLDAAVSSRMATYTQPTGFLAATFPSGTIANTTNITAGTIATVTNLTNAPTAGDFTAAMKTSLNAATPASVVGAVGSVSGNVGGSVASVTAGVTVTTNNDKTGYSLTQTFPANFSALGISAAGIMSADIKYVNAVLVNGNGAGTPWGP